MGILARLEERRLDPAAELSGLMDSAPDSGAVVSFVGVARPKTRSGASVDQVLLEHHPILTQRSVEEIARDAATRFDVGHVRVVHRFGPVAPGEPIVFAGAASAHRRAAFEAADYLMDRLKTDAVFWKREDGPAGSNWVEPTEADHADRARWE